MVTAIGIIMLIVLPIILSRFVWQVEVDAATIELEDEVAHYLQKEMGVEFPVPKKRFYPIMKSDRR